MVWLGQLVGVGPLLPSCESWRSNSSPGLVTDTITCQAFSLTPQENFFKEVVRLNLLTAHTSIQYKMVPR